MIAALVIGLDQLTKEWALATLDPETSVPVIDSVLYWVLRFNAGAAFSLLSGATWVFTIISSLVAIGIVFYLRHLQSSIWGIVGGLVLGGAVGNLIDRYFRDPGFAVGHVVDFIYTPWMMPAVYNIADIAVVSGMGLFLLCMIIGISSDGTRTSRKSATEPESSAE